MPEQTYEDFAVESLQDTLLASASHLRLAAERIERAVKRDNFADHVDSAVTEAMSELFYPTRGDTERVVNALTRVHWARENAKDAQIKALNAEAFSQHD